MPSAPIVMHTPKSEKYCIKYKACFHLWLFSFDHSVLGWTFYYNPHRLRIFLRQIEKVCILDFN